MQNPEQFKPQNNEKKNEQEKRVSVDRNTRAYLLEKLVLDMAKAYRGEIVPELQNSEKLNEKIPISKRTALISDYALSELLTRLSQENDVLNKALRSSTKSDGINIENANEQIKRNNVYIDMIEGNCIKSLDAVTDEVLFPKEDSL